MFSCFLPAAVYKGCHSTGKKCTVAISDVFAKACFSQVVCEKQGYEIASLLEMS